MRQQQQPGAALPTPNVGVNPNMHPQFQVQGGAPLDGVQGSGPEGDRRESVYDYHEISVWQMAQHLAGAGKKKSKRQWKNKDKKKRNW